MQALSLITSLHAKIELINTKKESMHTVTTYIVSVLISSIYSMHCTRNNCYITIILYGTSIQSVAVTSRKHPNFGCFFFKYSNLAFGNFNNNFIISVIVLCRYIHQLLTSTPILLCSRAN